MAISDEYKRIGKQQIIRDYPKPYKPNPVDNDYRRGWITRYFVKMKSNKNSPILEISESEYNRLSDQLIEGKKLLYNIVSLRWRISGDIIEVQESNTKITGIKELFIPGISLILSNRLQFWKK